MSYGYSQRLVDANKKASTKSLGVALGRICIDVGMPVGTVAERLGVSRATVYNWFWGVTHPDRIRAERVTKLIQTLKKYK